MQFLIPSNQSTKLFRAALAAAVFFSFTPDLMMAQVYQIQPDGALIYQTPNINPNPNPNPQQPNAVPPIYPGQIINGERVIGTSVPATPLSRPEAINPPTPAASSDLNLNQNLKPSLSNQPPQPSRRADKIPKTKFPIAAEPKLQLNQNIEANRAQADTHWTAPTPIKTTQNQESSPPPKEKSDLRPTLAASEDQLLNDQPPNDQLPNDGLPEGEMALDPAAIDEDILAEIKQIRDQLGGGISQTLKDVDQMPSFGVNGISSPQGAAGTSADGEISPDELFNEELRSVMSQQENNNRQSQPLPSTDASNRSSRPQTTYTDRVQQLRTCARELEQLAERLETIEAYEHADRLRRQAAEIWTIARQR